MARWTIVEGGGNYVRASQGSMERWSGMQLLGGDFGKLFYLPVLRLIFLAPDSPRRARETPVLAFHRADQSQDITGLLSRQTLRAE